MPCHLTLDSANSPPDPKARFEAMLSKDPGILVRFFEVADMGKFYIIMFHPPPRKAMVQYGRTEEGRLVVFFLLLCMPNVGYDFVADPVHCTR